MRLYALHDKKACALSAFHPAKSDAVASRDFASAVLEPKSLLGKYPEDFELVCVCELFEDTSVQTDPVMLLEGARFVVVLTAQQVVDLQSKAGERAEPAQLGLLREG